MNLENKIMDLNLKEYYLRSQGKEPDAKGMESSCYFYDDVVFKRVSFRTEVAERFQKTQEVLERATAEGKKVPEVLGFEFDFDNLKSGKVDGVVLEKKMTRKTIIFN